VIWLIEENILSYDNDFRKIPWDGFCVLEVKDQNSTIKKCIETLNLEEFDFTSRIVKSNLKRPSDDFLGFEPNDFEITDLKILFIVSLYFDTDDQIFDVENLFEILDSVSKTYKMLVFSNCAQKSKSYYTVNVPCSNINEFEKKVARHLEVFVEGQASGSPLNPVTETFTDLVIETENLSEKDIIIGESYILRVIKDNVPFEFHCNFRAFGDHLVVLGQDALNRNRVALPHFFRWRWTSSICASTLVLNDPTLYLSDDLNCGWFVGTPERDYLKECVSVVGAIKSLLQSRSPTVFYGASAGGFSSLCMASCSKDALAIVDIPQTNLFNYHARAEVDRLAKSAFGVASVLEVPDEYLYRFDCLGRFEHEQCIPRTIYTHNVKDLKHKDQVDYFLRGWLKLCHSLDSSKVASLSIETYSRWHISKGGHFPMAKNTAVKLINSVVNGVEG